MIDTNNPYRYRYGRDYFAKWTLPDWLSLGTYETAPFVYNFERSIGEAESGSLLQKYVLIDYPTGATVTNVRNRQFARLTSLTAVHNNYNALLDGLDVEGAAYNNVSGMYSRVTLGGGNTYQGTFYARQVEWNDGYIPVFLAYNGEHHSGGIPKSSSAAGGEYNIDRIIQGGRSSDHPELKLSFLIKKGNEARIFTPKYHGGNWAQGSEYLRAPTYSTIFLKQGVYTITKIFDVLRDTTRDFKWQKWERKTNKKTIEIEQTNGAYYLDFLNAQTEIYENWTYSD